MTTENNYLCPILPLRDIVVFPDVTVPLFVGRDKSIKALEISMEKYKKIILVAQKNPDVDDPNQTDLYSFGTEAEILQMLKLPDGTVKILVEGKKVVKISDIKINNGFLLGDIQAQNLINKNDNVALAKALVNKFDKLNKISKKFNEENNINLKNLTDPKIISNKIAANLKIDLNDKQKILEILDIQKKLETILSFLENEIDVLSVEKKIRGRVKNQMEKTQREYYLNEQLKAIQKELGDIEDGKDEVKQLEEAIKKCKMTKEAEEKSLSELKKLKTMSPMSAESTVVRNYLDWMTGLPWQKMSEVNTDIKRAEDILNKDHYGLEKVKDRILEFLAVQSRIKKIKGPILCLLVLQVWEKLL